MTIKRLLNYLSTYKKHVTLIIIIVISSAIINILTPKILGDFITSIYDSITSSSPLDKNNLSIILIILSTLYFSGITLNYFENYLTSILGQKVLHALRNKTNQKLSSLNLSYYDTHSKGELLSRFNNDLESIGSLYTQVIPKIITYTITFIGTLLMMLFIDLTLTLITILVVPLVAIISKLLLKLSRKKRTQYFQKLGALNAITAESYLNQPIVSSFNNDKLIIENFNKLNKDLAKTNIKSSLLTGLLVPLSSLINYLVYLLILIIGSKHVLDGKLKFGDIQTLIQYTKQLGTPINNFSSLLGQIQNSILAANRIFEILDEKSQDDNGSNKIETIEQITFDNVCFSYNDSPFITNLNLKINKGEKIAIIGETGSGKSTIINLLMRFYKIQEGKILINNKSIYEYNLKEYYKQISLVTQDPWLLNDTIKNNLKYGNLTATTDELISVCKRANCYNIIDSQPNKFNEIIEEFSQNISQGEKQLLTITRALLKNHSLLILDEATSSIDSKTEKIIEQTIQTTCKDKITLIIAHRLSTIINADKIIVLKDGKIIELGTPKDLYKQKGEYYRFLQAL